MIRPQSLEQMSSLFPVTVTVPVIWGDMDAFGHVNNTVYLRYFENARLAYLEQVGYLEYMDETGLGIILAETRCRYRLPLTYPDTVVTGTRLKSLADDRFVMEYAVFSEQHQKLAASGEGNIVSFDYRQNSKAPIPVQIRERMVAMEPRFNGQSTA